MGGSHSSQQWKEGAGVAGVPVGAMVGWSAFLCPASLQLLRKQPPGRHGGQGLAGSGAQHSGAAWGVPLRGRAEAGGCRGQLWEQGSS